MDERGYFVRTFCGDEFRRHGVDERVAQISMAYNIHAGTLRGLHYQSEPYGETKLVRCVRGRVFDVVVDLRSESSCYRESFCIELSEERPCSIVVPPGVAHGYLTLTADCSLVYQMSVPYVSEASAGVRWDDPDLAIPWPDQPAVIGARDQELPLLGVIEQGKRR
ncbi:MAG: dTDP-4-dehydrorhamnose 3,5-epimerase family protein [Sulfobacillus sp.]